MGSPSIGSSIGLPNPPAWPEGKVMRDTLDRVLHLRPLMMDKSTNTVPNVFELLQGRLVVSQILECWYLSF